MASSKKAWANSDRARSARRACEEFARVTGQDMGDELRDIVHDLAANLMHLWHEEGGDAYDLVRVASDHFQVEYEHEEFGEDE